MPLSKGPKRAPSGVFLPCSQFLNLAKLIPIIEANSICVALAFLRIFLISGGENIEVRAGFFSFVRIFPPSCILSTNNAKSFPFILGLTTYIFGSLNSGTNSWSIFSISSGALLSKAVR